MTTAVPMTNPTSVKMISIFGSSEHNNKLSVDSQSIRALKPPRSAGGEDYTRTVGPRRLCGTSHARQNRTSCESTDARSHLPADDALLREEEETPDAG